MQILWLGTDPFCIALFYLYLHDSLPSCNDSCPIESLACIHVPLVSDGNTSRLEHYFVAIQEKKLMQLL